jgi:hypothetical protein
MLAPRLSRTFSNVFEGLGLSLRLRPWLLPDVGLGELLELLELELLEFELLELSELLDG